MIGFITVYMQLNIGFTPVSLVLSIPDVVRVQSASEDYRDKMNIFSLWLRGVGIINLLLIPFRL